VRPHPLGVLQKNSGSTNFENSETADGTIIIITNFYLGAGSNEIFLRVGGREGMKGIGAFQRHQLLHPPCKNPASATGSEVLSTQLTDDGPVYHALGVHLSRAKLITRFDDRHAVIKKILSPEFGTKSQNEVPLFL